MGRISDEIRKSLLVVQKIVFMNRSVEFIDKAKEYMDKRIHYRGHWRGQIDKDNLGKTFRILVFIENAFICERFVSN